MPIIAADLTGPGGAGVLAPDAAITRIRTIDWADLREDLPRQYGSRPETRTS